MPFDANGNYTLPTIYIAIPGEVIKSTQHNTPFEDVQAALNNTLCCDGRTPWTGNQNANNNKLTGLAKGTNSTDAVRMDQAATLDGVTDFTGKVTVQDVDDWTSNEPVPAKQADSRYLKIASGLLKTDTAVSSAWMDLTSEAGYPRLGVAGANGTTYGFYGIAKVNALIGGCIQNTNPGIAKALAGTSLCVNPADGLPYLAYNGNTQIVALARDEDKLDVSGGQVNYLRVGTSLFVLGNECAVYNSAVGAWVNTYVDSNGNATWDLNGGSPDNNTGNKAWFRMAPDGHLWTGKGNVALQSDLPFADKNLRWFVVRELVTKDGSGQSTHIFPVAFAARTQPFVLPVGSREDNTRYSSLPMISLDSADNPLISNTGMTLYWSTGSGNSICRAWLTYLVGGYF